jgi:hypothetical protein
VFRAHNVEGHEQLGGNAVAPPFHFVIGDAQRLRVRYRRLAEPDVSQLVREREHLRRLRVRAVDENERSKFVGQRESTKLLGIEAAAELGARCGAACLAGRGPDAWSVTP